MSSRWGAELACEHCGARYRDLRTGLTFAAVRRDMRSFSDDPREWRSLWLSHLAWCEKSVVGSEDERGAHGA